VILIGGTSHVGKSTLAQALASQLGWQNRSTDKLARHPGRPWQVAPQQVPPHVADHYLSLSPEALLADVLRHYRENVWPLVKDIVSLHATDCTIDRLIMEGSALLPELVVTLMLENVAAFWLTASDTYFTRRIYQNSQYETKSPREKRMIDQFLARTWLYNARMMSTVERLGLVSVDIERVSSRDDLVSIILRSLRDQSSPQ
jgi:2-phosphoglycerate kinase